MCVLLKFMLQIEEARNYAAVVFTEMTNIEKR